MQDVVFKLSGPETASSGPLSFGLLLNFGEETQTSSRLTFSSSTIASSTCPHRLGVATFRSDIRFACRCKTSPLWAAQAELCGG